MAPAWSNGSPVALEEQQVVSACLGALVNKYGRSVLISILGSTAQGQPIPATPSELDSFTIREGCFFGNLFNGEGLFVGNDQGLLPPAQSSLRACALAGPNACPPLTHLGSCHASCQQDSTGSYFTRCTYKGSPTIPSPPGSVPRTSTRAVTASASPASPAAPAIAPTAAGATAAPAAEALSPG